MEEELYEYEGEQYTEKELRDEYGERFNEAIERFGFKKIEKQTKTNNQEVAPPKNNNKEYSHKGSVYTEKELREQYGDNLDKAIKKFGFKEVKKKDNSESSSEGGSLGSQLYDNNGNMSEVAEKPFKPSKQQEKLDNLYDAYKVEQKAKWEQETDLPYPENEGLQKVDEYIAEKKEYRLLKDQYAAKYLEAYKDVSLNDISLGKDPVGQYQEQSLWSKIVDGDKQPDNKFGVDFDKMAMSEVRDLKINQLIDEDLKPNYSVKNQTDKLALKNPEIPRDVLTKKIKDERYKEAMSLLPSDNLRELSALNIKIKKLYEIAKTKPKDDAIWTEYADAKSKREVLLSDEDYDFDGFMFDEEGQAIDQDYLQQGSSKKKRSLVDLHKSQLKTFKEASKDVDSFVEMWDDKFSRFKAIEAERNKAIEVEINVKMRNHYALKDIPKEHLDNTKERSTFWTNEYSKAKMEFMAINQVMLTNIDPSQIKRKWYQNVAIGIDEGLSSTVEGFGLAKEKMYSNSKLSEIYNEVANKEGFSITEAQKINSKLSFDDELSRATGQSIVAAAEIALTSGVGSAANGLKAVKYLEKLSRLKYGRFGQSAFNAIKGATLEGAAFGLAPSENSTFAMGVGENIGQNVFGKAIERMGGFKNKYLKFLSKVASGATGETIAEYSGEMIGELASNGFDMEKAIDEVVGKDADEIVRKLALTGLMTTMFSTTSNLSSATYNKVNKELSKLPKGTKGKTELEQKIEELNNINNNTIIKDDLTEEQINETIKAEINNAQETKQDSKKTEEPEVPQSTSKNQEQSKEEIDEDFTENVYEDNEYGDFETIEEDTVELETQPEQNSNTEASTQNITEPLAESNPEESVVENKQNVEPKQEVNANDIDVATTKQAPKNNTVSDNLNYSVRLNEETGLMEVLNQDGSKPKLTKATENKYIQEYIDKTNFDTGKKAITENTTQDVDVAELVANESENAFEVAQTLAQTNFKQELDPVQEAIARNVSNINRSSFEDNVGFSGKKEGVNQSYFSKQGGNSLDEIQMKIIEDLGYEYNAKDADKIVSLDDITSFMLDNNGANSFLKKSNPVKTELKAKFESLTGLKATPKNINRVAEINLNESNESQNIDDSVDFDDVPFEPKAKYDSDTDFKDAVDKSHGNMEGFEKNKKEVAREMSSKKKKVKKSKKQKLKLPKAVDGKYNSILNEFKQTGSVEVVGKKVSSPEQLADVFLLHRSAKVEKGHVVYVKNGEIVHATLETLGLPYATEFESRGANVIKETAKKVGADKIYLLHNHPSGNPTPSKKDVSVTERFSKELDGYNLEHLVINSKKFSVIDGNGNVSKRTYLKRPKRLFNKRIDLKNKDKQISSESIFEVATQLSKGGAKHHVAYVDSSGRLAGYEFLDGNETNIEEQVLKNMLDYGAAEYVIVTDGSSQSINTLSKGDKPNRLDFVKVADGKNPESLAFRSDKRIGVNTNNTLFEETPDYDSSRRDSDSIFEQNKELKEMNAELENSIEALKTKSAKSSFVRKTLQKKLKDFIDNSNIKYLKTRSHQKILTAINNAETQADLDAALETFQEVNEELAIREIIDKARSEVKSIEESEFQAYKDNLTKNLEGLGDDFFTFKLDGKNVKGIRVSEVKKVSKILSQKDVSPSDIIKAANTLQDLFFELESRRLMKSIDTQLKRKLKKKQSGKAVAGTLDDGGVKVIGTIKLTLKEYFEKRKGLKGEARHDFETNFLEELFSLQRKYVSEHGINEDLSNQITAVNITIGILNAKTTSSSGDKLISLKEADTELKNVINESRSRHKEWADKRKKFVNDFVLKGLKSNNIKGKSIQASEKKIKAERNAYLASIAKRGFQMTSGSGYMGDFNSVMQYFDKAGADSSMEGFAAELGNEIRTAETNKTYNLSEYGKTIKAKEREIFGNPKAKGRFSDSRKDDILLKKHSFVIKEARLKEATGKYDYDDKLYTHVTLTESQLLNLWMHYRNPELHAGFDAAGYDAEFMKNVDAVLNPKTKEYGEFLFEFYEDYYKHINKVYKQMYGISLGKPKHYAGKLAREGFETTEQDLLNVFQTSRTTAGSSTKERVNNSLPVVAQDVNQALQKYLFESEHFVQYAELQNRYNALVKDPRIRNSVMQNNKLIGDVILKNMEYYMDIQMLQGGVDNARLKVFDVVMANTVKATLAIKPKIFLTQTISLPNSVKYMPKGAYRIDKFITSFPSDLKYILKNSKYIKNRLDTNNLNKAITGIDNVRTDELFQTKGGKKMKQLLRFYNQASNALMFNVKAGDFVGVTGSVPVFTAWKAEYEKRGFTPEVATEKAMQQFEAAVDMAQQGQTKMSKSFVQNHPLGKYFAMYATSPMQNYRNAISSAIEIRRFLKKDAEGNRTNKGSLLKHFVSVANFTLLQPLLYTWVAGRLQGGLSALFGDEDIEDLTEDEKSMLSALMLRNTSSMPVVGSMMLLVVDTLILEKKHSFGGVMSSALFQEAGKLEKLYKRALGAKKEKDKKKFYFQMIQQFAQLTSGIPFKTATQYMGLINDLLKADEEYTELDFMEKFWLWSGHSKKSLEEDRQSRRQKERR